MKWFNMTPFTIQQLTLSQVFNYVNGAMRFEQDEYMLNQPAMSEGKKWGRQVERHLNDIWDMCYPKLQSWADRQKKAKKRRAKRAKRKLDKINKRL